MGKRLSTNIIEIGSKAGELMEGGMIILFGKEAPENIKEYCVIIGNHNLEEDINLGDILKIDKYKFRIEYVGDVVNENFSNLGHITLNFKTDFSKDPLPGGIYLDSYLKFDLNDSMEISILSNNEQSKY